MNTHDPCDTQFTIRYYEKIRAPPSLTRPVPETTVAAESGVDRTWWSCGAFSVCDGQPTIENSGPCDGYSVSPFGRPPHPSALSHTGIGNVFD